MIKGKQKPTLSKETILDRISEYDIYRFYNGDFSVNKACIYKHRGESSPSLIIFQTETGQLGHKDYGDMSWRGDCFAFVEQIFRCSRVVSLDSPLEGVRFARLKRRSIDLFQLLRVLGKRADSFVV